VSSVLSVVNGILEFFVSLSFGFSFCLTFQKVKISGTDETFQWNVWAAPKLRRALLSKDGTVIERVEVDHNALTGDNLAEFVNNKPSSGN